MKNVDFEFSKSVNAHIETGGDGFWSRQKKTVTITSIANDDHPSELRVYFDTATWDTRKDGLIYTDRKFLLGVKKLLPSIGFPSKWDVEYSEQGMQGDDFVSLDIYFKK